MPLPNIPDWSRRRLNTLNPFSNPSRNLTSGFAKKGSKSPEPWLLRERGPIENVRRPWDAWLEEERYLQTHTPPRPLMTRYKAHMSPDGDYLSPALEEERRQHPDSTMKRHTVHPKDEIGRDTVYLMVTEANHKGSGRCVGTVQRRHHAAGHRFWLKQRISPSHEQKATTLSLIANAGGTGLRVSTPRVLGEANQHQEYPILYRRKAPVERTLGLTETQMLGHCLCE